jgi:heat shock protein HslJ
MKRLVVTILVTAALLLPTSAGLALAQEPAESGQCTTEYTVQAGDWLSKIAEKYLGDMLAFDQLVELANASPDDAYSDIANPDVIEPGMVICIPAGTPGAGMDGAMSGEAPEGLSPAELANATYPDEFYPSGSVTLQNGQHSEPAAPGSASMISTQLLPVGTYGTLAGQPVAVVVLATNGGGSGTFITMHVMFSQNGQPVSIANAALGDRTQVNSISIENEQIKVDMVQVGPDDPFCCPSQQVIKTFELQDGQLVEVSSEEVSSGSSQSESAAGSIVGPEWQWETLIVQATQETTTVPNPENYTLTLREDGNFSGKADCNQISGTYSTDGGLSFTLGPSTMAFCGEESLDQQYLQLLGSVVAGGPSGDGLALETAGGAERMEFGNGSAAANLAEGATPTQVIPFNVTSIPVDSGQTPQPATCDASAEVPGAYACTTDAGGKLNPCIVVEEQTLMCNPNPAFGSYSSLVLAGNSLPSVPVPVQTPFSLLLNQSSPPCQLRTNGIYEISGMPVTYNCDAPGAWIVGPLDQSQPAWIAQYIITNPSDGSVATGPTATPVMQAWVY